MWQGQERIEPIKKKLVRWLPINYCRRCGHWTNMGMRNYSCGSCNHPKTVLIKTERGLMRTRMYVLDEGGLI